MGAQRAVSPTPSSHRSTPIQSPPPPAAVDAWDDAGDWGKPEPAGSVSPATSATSSVMPMTKEEKAAEMARKKEERKQASYYTSG
jgi:SCY1-like protein 1